MTNTSFIGDVNRFSNNDKITPFYSYKVVSMLPPDENGVIKLYGPHHPKHHYGLSDEALCSGKKCKDFEKCSCGFYGYSLVEDALEHWAMQCDGKFDVTPVLVQVAFSGQVVVCKKGYRASHQRVRKMLLSSCCLCSSPGEMLAPHTNGNLVPICAKCLETSEVKKPWWNFSKKTLAEKPVIPTISFNDFAEKQSPTGFVKIKIGSVGSLEDVDFVQNFFEAGTPFAFLPGDNSDIPSNFADYLSSLNNNDMDRMLSLVSNEMGRRLSGTDSDSDIQPNSL